MKVAKITAKSLQTMGPKTIIKCIKLNIWLWRPSLHVVQSFCL